MYCTQTLTSPQRMFCSRMLALKTVDIAKYYGNCNMICILKGLRSNKTKYKTSTPHHIHTQSTYAFQILLIASVTPTSFVSNS